MSATDDLDYEVANPNPAALIESLRAFGYSTASAIADLIDNSITAGAKNVWIAFFWDGPDSYIRIDDDGAGMNETELSAAMPLGSRSPTEDRDPRDLGRFGLGLKSASFSQCRVTTVTSLRGADPPATRVWDVDYVRRTKQWRLRTRAEPLSVARIAEAPARAHGTSVLWERLDRVVDGSPASDGRAQQQFLLLAEQVERHLGMTFHRFMEPPGRLRIWINKQRVAPWDPFLRDSPTTETLAAETLRFHGQAISVVPFVLPHHSKIEPEAHRSAAGQFGWNAHQGFYVYRNRRLLVAGDWLGLPMQKEEHFKLARIRLDLPNSMDEAWHIDVRKAVARPPGVLRADLLRIARATRERAASVYRFRGKQIARASAAKYVFVWQRVVSRDRVHYRVNRDHPLVSAALAGDGQDATRLRALVRLIEETVPAPLIVIDHAEQEAQQAAPFEGAPSRELGIIFVEVCRAMRKSGLALDSVRERVGAMEPFSAHPELVATLDELWQKGAI